MPLEYSDKSGELAIPDKAFCMGTVPLRSSDFPNTRVLAVFKRYRNLVIGCAIVIVFPAGLPFVPAKSSEQKSTTFASLTL